MPSSRHTGVDGLAPEPLRVPRWICVDGSIGRILVRFRHRHLPSLPRLLHPRVRDPALQEDERVGVAALRPSPPSTAQGHRVSDVPRLFIRRTAPPPLRALCLHSTSRAPPPLMSQPSSTVSTSPLSPPTQFTMRAPGLCAALASTTMIRVPAIVLCPPRLSLTGSTAPARRTLGRIARRLLHPLSLATRPPLTPTYHSPRTSTRSIPAMYSAVGTPFASPVSPPFLPPAPRDRFHGSIWLRSRARYAAVPRAVPALMDCRASINSAFEYAYMY
ncbi:hypothetical protein B0H13DRAFT_2085744 [Mycena leptocephala]|nr:hypothetical protein B0H13DRAFT_2085744 [Mycena leptocephala]